jgi:hypothetical protein
MLVVKSVSYVENYKLRVKLSNFREGIFDLKPYLDKGIFKQLQCENYARLVKANFAGICWPNGQDFSADTLNFELQ